MPLPLLPMAVSSHKIRVYDSLGHKIRAPVNCSSELDEDVPGTLSGIASSGDVMTDPASNTNGSGVSHVRYQTSNSAVKLSYGFYIEAIRY